MDTVASQMFANALLKWTLLQRVLKCNTHRKLNSPTCKSTTQQYLHGDKEVLQLPMTGMVVSVTKVTLCRSNCEENIETYKRRDEMGDNRYYFEKEKFRDQDIKLWTTMMTQ